MGSALYIVAEQKDLKVELSVCGKALARAHSELEQLAIRLGVTPLMHFFSADRESLSAFLDEKEMAAVAAIPEEQWYSAAEGLRTVRGLTSQVQSLKLAAENQVLADLDDFEQVLSYLDDHNIRWHLSVDF